MTIVYIVVLQIRYEYSKDAADAYVFESAFVLARINLFCLTSIRDCDPNPNQKKYSQHFFPNAVNIFTLCTANVSLQVMFPPSQS